MYIFYVVCTNCVLLLWNQHTKFYFLRNLEKYYSSTKVEFHDSFRHTEDVKGSMSESRLQLYAPTHPAVSRLRPKLNLSSEVENSTV